MDGRPMDGIRVLDAATFIAGPHAATILGALGLSPDDIAALARKGVVWARGGSLALRLASPGGGGRING